MLETAPTDVVFVTDEEYTGDPALADAALAAELIWPINETWAAEGIKARFVTATETEPLWAHPTIFLGYRANRREGRIFVVPDDFMRELPAIFDAADFFRSEHILQWLINKGLMKGNSYERLPDIEFDEEKGYGWRAFGYELLQLVGLQLKRKPDGSTGLWMDGFPDEISHFYPALFGFDTVAVPVGFETLGFTSLDMEGSSRAYRSGYELLEWPVDDTRYMPDGKLPYGGVALGLIEPAHENLPEIEGWLDDADNAELQELLLGKPDGVRFVPKIATTIGAAVPCSSETVAAAILANLTVSEDDRIDRILLNKAQRAAEAGLGYHDAVLGRNHALIDAICSFEERE